VNRLSLIQKLKRDIVHGGVVIIAGPGVSIAACGNQMVDGHPVASWTGLMQHALEYCRNLGLADEEDVELLRRQIASGKQSFLVAAAEDISQRLQSSSPGVFRAWLQDTVGALVPKHREVLKPLAALPGVLATLNYDRLIEKATSRRAVTWLREAKVQEVLRREVTDAVLHLHGCFDEPESVVLGVSRYGRVVDHPHTRAVLQLFTLDRTLLFVGCGAVKDPNFFRLIELGKEALKDVALRHVLLCREEELTTVRADLESAPWLQPLVYGNVYEDLGSFLRSLVPTASAVASGFARQPAEITLNFEAYQKAVRKYYSRLKLEVLDPMMHGIIRPVTLSGMFIAQSARECAEFMPQVFELPKESQRRLRDGGELQGAELDEETLAQLHRAYLDRSPRPVLEVVNNPAFSRLVILGDPGSGKSTLLQYLLLHWAEDARNLKQDPLPLLIELREYARLRAQGKIVGFLEYFQSGAALGCHFDQVQLESWLRANPSIVLFDGLDEVFDPALRREVSTAIHRFADEYPAARVIITSRIIGYHHQAWRAEGFRHFILQELEDAQIEAFLVHWHHAAYEGTHEGHVECERLVRAIKDSTPIRQLAGNPLLLTMIAILSRTHDLRRDRIRLYEKCTELLLHQWQVQGAFDADPVLRGATLDFRDKRNLLLRVARAMQSGEHGIAGHLIDEHTLQHVLTDGLKGVPNLRPDRAARALIDQLRGRNFMLCSVGGSYYAFVHRAFLDYFCALEIGERFQTEQTLGLERLKSEIFAHWEDDSWHEVLCLLCGMMAPRFVSEVLAYLLQQPDPQQTCDPIFLAARCVGEVRKRNELGPIVSEVLDRVKALVHFDLNFFYQPWDEEHETVTAIRRRSVMTIATVWRDARNTRSWLEACALSHGDSGARAAAVQELARGWKEDPNTLLILKARAQSDRDPGVRATAVRELARGWREDPDTFEWLKARVRSDKDSGVRVAAVQELARGWKDDADILPWLKACAQPDVHSGVRAAAVQELVRSWKEDPETFSWLKGCAQSDEDASVRVAAVQELARGWKEDPDTGPIVKAHAQSDGDAGVRAAAVRELARGWKEDPDTLPMVKACAQSDQHAGVRAAVVQELARGWKEDPDTLPWLKVCVQSDKDSGVRVAALRELARGWKEDPDTLPMVKACAQSDEFSGVRTAVVQELAHAWKGDPDTLTWLKACAQSDQDSGVRAATVLELARGWKEESDTLPWLKACAQADVDASVRAAAVQELTRGWKQDPDTLPMLKACAQSDKDSGVRATAVRELARGWKEDPDILSWLKACAQSNEDSWVRVAAVQELTRGWKEDPDTLPMLKACGQSDKDSGVRAAAVQELARGWKEDPETLLMLKAYAQSDVDSGVRTAAVRELASAWEEDPETLPIIKARARADEDSSVRAAAVQELARGWKDDPDTLLMLKACAQFDQDFGVRAAAVQELARGWKEDPDTLLWLKACAQSDGDFGMRAVAVQELARGWTEPLFGRALSIDEKSFGPDHPNVAIRLNNLAGMLRATNRLAEAEPLFRRALSIYEKSFGPDHLQVAITLNNLAELFRATNRLAEAEPLFRRALSIYEKSFGPDHPQVAITLNNLAEVLRATNRPTEAERLHRRALAIDKKSFGMDVDEAAIDIREIRLAIGDPSYLNYSRLGRAVTRRMGATNRLPLEVATVESGLTWEITLPPIGLRLPRRNAVVFIRQKEDSAAFESLARVAREKEAAFLFVIDIVGIPQRPAVASGTRIVWLRPENVVALATTPDNERVAWLGRFITTHVDVKPILPYQTAGAATKDFFFGREDELARLVGVNPRGGIIIGAHQSGKSSLLHHLGRKLASCQRQVVGPLTFGRVENDFRSFFERTLHPLGLDLSGSITPQAWASTLRSYSRKCRRPVFLLDEVDGLLELDARCNSELGSHMRALQSDGHCDFYLAGHKQLRDAIAREEGPFRNFAEQVILTGLSKAAAARLIKEPIRNLGFEFSDRQVERITKGTGGVAVLIQEFCIRLLQNLGDFSQSKIKAKTIRDIERSPNFLGDVFRHFLYGQTRLSISVMVLAAIQREVTRQMLHHELSKRNVPSKREQLDQALTFLTNFGVLEEFLPGYYRIVAKYLIAAVKAQDPGSLLESQRKDGGTEDE
jgi:predicted NACHT family NTPase